MLLFIEFRNIIILKSRNGRLDEAEKYVDKISIPEEKYEMFVELKLWRKALDVAAKLRDPYKLQEVNVYYFVFLFILFCIL
jgi:hypothetical protein